MKFKKKKNWSAFFRRGAVLFFFLFANTSLFSQAPFFKAHELNDPFQKAKPEIIYEDPEGPLWLGTSEGLFLYDGLKFWPYLKSDSTSNHVHSIYRDKKQRFWVGYEDGSIYHLIGKILQKWEPPEGTPSAPVNGFVEDGLGNVWFSTYGEGVYCWDENTHPEHPRMYNLNVADDHLLGNDIYEMTVCQAGNVWLGTDGGISVCNFSEGKKNVTNYTREDGLPDEIVRAILPDGKGNLWIGTYEGGVCFFDAKKGVFTHPLPEQELGIINCLEVFEGTEVWVGTLGNGAWRYSLQEQKLTHIPSLKNAKVSDLLQDTEGNIWVLSNLYGIRSANRQFELIKTPFENAQALHVDSQDRLWVGTSEGLFCLKKDKNGNDEFTTFPTPETLNVLSIFEDLFGNLWVGTFGQGLYVFHPNNGQVRHLTSKDGLSNDNILSIDGQDQRIWLATLGGATEIAFEKNIFDGAALKFQKLDHESGLSANFIYKVYIDKKGQTWFGTDGKGVSVLENGRVTNYPINTDGKEGPSTVYSITEAPNGHIWLSTDKFGLFEFDGQSFSPLPINDGIRDLEITSLASSKNGEIVIVHPSGIDLLLPDASHLVFYDQEVGIENLDANLNAVCTDRFGHVWVGGKNTIIKFTALEEELEIHPRTILNSVSTSFEAVDFQSVNYFSHDKNNLVFDYMGLWYTDPEVVKYRYRLEGYDHGWIESKDRQATYSNLPSGKYAFQLMSTENETWSDEPAIEYAFEIGTPFWMRWWFVLLCLHAIAGLFYLYQKNRDKRLQRVNLLEKDKAESQLAALKAQINPHFLFNSFNTLITVIEEDPKTAVEYVENLSDFYRKIIQLRNKDLISIQEEIELVKNYGFLLEKRYGDNFHMKIHLNGEVFSIVPLTLQILVENAVKHNIISKNKPLTIDIQMENDEYISVSNNLQRKLTQEKSTHFGLQSLVQRYDLVDGKKVKVEETEEHFKIWIPIIE